MNIARILVVLWLSISLAACGGGGGSNNSLGSSSEDSSSEDSSSEGSGSEDSGSEENESEVGGGVGNNETDDSNCAFGTMFGSTCVTPKLNCSDLDSGKVYIRGTYVPNNDRFALGDPEDPTATCIGFPDNRIGSIRHDGRYIYIIDDDDGKQIAEFVPDQLAVDEEDVAWNYPENPELNDTVLRDLSVPFCAVPELVLSPDSNDFVYSCDDTWYRQDGSLVVGMESQEESILALLQDGSVITTRFNLSKIRRIDPQGSAQSITFEGDVNVFTQKLIKSKHTENGLWLLLEDSDDIYTRWLLQGTTAVLDGQYAGMPENTWALGSFQMDGDGNLWLIGQHYAGERYVLIIVKRPLTPNISEIIYSEPDTLDLVWWTETAYPYIFIDDASLVTGP